MKTELALLFYRFGSSSGSSSINEKMQVSACDCDCEIDDDAVMIRWACLCV